MTVTVSTVQRATLQFDRNSTVADLIQALTENLGGEWDDARLSVMVGGRTGTTVDDGWTLTASMDTEPEPVRPSRWVTETNKHGEQHVAVWDATQNRRQCNCGATGSDEVIAEHLSQVAGFKWAEE